MLFFKIPWDEKEASLVGPFFALWMEILLKYQYAKKLVWSGGVGPGCDASSWHYLLSPILL